MPTFRAPAILFLKATTTTTITVPGYYRKDGTFVPPHQKLVHINPDKSKADVLSGKGSHSQKVAHSKLSKLPGWASMTEDEQHAHILSWATNYQQKQSAAAAVSGWKASMLAGKKPTASQMKAYAELASSDPGKFTAVSKEVFDAIGSEKMLELLQTAGGTAPTAKPDPASGAQADEPVATPAEPAEAEAGGAQAAGQLTGKPAYDHVVQSAKNGIHPKAAAEEWLADNPDGHAELSEALVDLSLDDVAADMDLPAPGSDETGAQAAATQPTDAEQHAAQNTIDDLVAGHGGHYPVKAAKAITAKLKEDPEFLSEWGSLSFVQRLQKIVDLAKEMQAAASASAAVSGWKKAAHAGKNPTPAQWKAFYALPAGKKAEMLSAVHAAAGGTDHLKAPAATVLLNAIKENDEAEAAQQAAVPAQEAPAASAQAAANAPAAVKKLQAIDPSAVSEWLNSEPGKMSEHAMSFFDHVTKPAHTKFIKWVQSSNKPGYAAHWKQAFLSAAISSLYGKYDMAMLADGTFKPTKSITAADVEVGIVTDPAKIQAAAIAEKMPGASDQAAATPVTLSPSQEAAIVDALKLNGGEMPGAGTGVGYYASIWDSLSPEKQADLKAKASPPAPAKPQSPEGYSNNVYAKWIENALDAGLPEQLDAYIDALKNPAEGDHEGAVLLKYAQDAKAYLTGEPVQASAPAHRLTGNKYTKQGEHWVNSQGKQFGPGSWRHTALSVLNGDPVDEAVPYGARQVALDALMDAEHGGHGLSPGKVLNALYPPHHSGLQEGDTKTINGVTYVLKGGRWHKVVAADEHGEVPPVLVPADDELPGHAKTIVDDVAKTGNKAVLQQIIDTAEPAMAAYVSEKLAELQGSGEPDVPSGGQVPDAVDPAGADAAGGDQGAQTTDLAGKEAEWDVFHNTEPGHNKFWAVSVVGESMITHYGKIGAAGTTTVKHFKSYGAALAAASKLQTQKQAKGYAHKGVFQYPIPEGAKAAPKPASATVKPKPALESADGWPQTGPQGGSNPGGRFKDPSGQEWYIKLPASEAHAKNELLAAKLYEAAGIKVPELKLVTKDGKVGIASKWVDGMSKAKHPDELAMADGALSGFAVDAWLANWDVTGLGLDNLLVGPDGKAVRIDVGGSLLFRAQGSPKGAAFGNEVTELQSLVDTKMNQLSAALFGGMSKAAQEKSAERVLKVSDAQIGALVDQFGPGSAAERAALAQKLIARKAAIAAAFPKAKGAANPAQPKPKLDPTALPVNPNDLPPYHDFHNWNGPGKGLSSKPHINDANLKAEKDLHDFALKGNLIALKDYHFEAIDKETGASLGMQPIAKHPSQHVKLYHSDLVQYLDAIANPPEPLRVAEGNDPTQFKAEKLGKTISTVQANKKLGFWVALGKLAKAEPFVKYFVGKEKQVSSAYKTQAKAKGIDHLPKLARRFINRVQSSGSYNDYFRDGHDSDGDGYSTAAIAEAAYAAASEKPVGTTIYRWQNMPESMVKQILAAEPGLVFQNPGSMCTSMHPTATSGFGQHRMVIHFAEGAKAVDSFASGSFTGEQEITTLMGQRFMLLRSEMSNNLGGIGKKGLEIHVLMLPPDPDYVADLQQRAATTSLKKSHRVFNELMGIEA